MCTCMHMYSVASIQAFFLLPSVFEQEVGGDLDKAMLVHVSRVTELLGL